MELQEDILYKKEHVPIDIEYHGVKYKGEATPISASCRDGVCFELEISLNDELIGIINSTMHGWVMQGEMEQDFADKIGEEILLWYGKY